MKVVVAQFIYFPTYALYIMYEYLVFHEWEMEYVHDVYTRSSPHLAWCRDREYCIAAHFQKLWSVDFMSFKYYVRWYIDHV